jgi:hypothetical protein
MVHTAGLTPLLLVVALLVVDGMSGGGIPGSTRAKSVVWVDVFECRGNQPIMRCMRN